ncbi:MAG: formate C-acetyltransferase [Bacillota bacterium]|nr:formate C-acetyltransferase [Bacillota bacterium]
MKKSYWDDFKGDSWKENINLRDFIVSNYKPYDGESSFLSKGTFKTRRLWDKCKELLAEEAKNGGVLDVDTETISGINSFAPGFIDEGLEIIKGLQTDKPLKRSVAPYGGIRTVKQSCEKYGYKLSEKINEIFTNYRKTHNEGVFGVYTPEMKKARKSGVITGLPDAYGRGRIIGDYRRVALYGVDRLIDDKTKDFNNLIALSFDDNTIKLREELSEQINSLKELKDMALSYGFDISNPAASAFEAFEWTYLAFLGAMKETNGAANSLGRVSTFLDIYIERDIERGALTEEEAQELVDQFIIKLRMIRHLRTPEYNELFAGDPVWITESIGGMCKDGRHMVTKTSFRFLQSLYNIGSSPEPNLTILWSNDLPANFKNFCTKVSIDTCTLQYENDNIMRPIFGDDYGISCCVSAMRIGLDMQYFGARCNLPKLLLMALNGGRDEITGDQVAPVTEPYEGEYLDYENVLNRFNDMQKWLTGLYVNTMNMIHYMHDKYAYERLMMSLHDTDVKRYMAFGIAGLSVIADSFSAMKHAKVKVIKDERGLITDFEIEGDFPKYGNDDDSVDQIAVSVVENFYKSLEKHQTYRSSKHTLSVLTITSNVVYGSKTGSTPDGRKKGEAFAPGANPMHGRDVNGILASLNTLAKIPYEYCLDGISYTLSIVPQALGKTSGNRITNLAAILDGYFISGGHHVNINIMERAILEEAMKDPYKYPHMTVRVSGYAVNFNKLSKKQQLEVMNRTFHGQI